MKNLNLIKRLWTDSHEKQSLQRFARYAAMLIMLLTLGVGQMWAYWHVPGTHASTGWTSADNNESCMNGDNYVTFYAVAAGTYEFKLVKGETWGHGNFTNKSSSIITSVCSNCSNGNNKFVINTIADVTFHITNQDSWNCDISAVASSYFIKYPWGDNHAWTFSAPMTACSDGTYACTGPYNGTTYDFGRRGYDGGAGAKTAQTATVNNSPSTDQTCVFNVTTSGALTITRCNKVTPTNKIYFDNSVSNFTGNIYLIIGHDKPTKYSCAYKMTQLAGTKLHYVSVDANWTDATYYAIVGNSAASISAGSWGSESLSTKQTGGYTAAYTGKYDFDGSNKQYLLTTSSSGNGQALTITYKNTGYSNLNYTQSVTLCTKAYGADTYSANTSSLTSLNFTTYNLTGVGSVSTQQTNNMNGSTGVASGSACQAATTTINVGDAPASWVYDGIYTDMNGGSQISDDQLYTYYPTAATNYYVRFHEVHDPSVSLAASSAYLTTTGGLRALKDEVITLNATATYTAGSPVRYTYEYSTNGGSTWNSIASSVTSASQTYTPTTTGDYKFRVTLPNETGTPSAITNVHVTKMYTINVKKNSNWTPNKLYIWNKSTEITQYGAFPGATGKFTNRGQWYSFELNSDFDSFIISASEHASNHTKDVNNVTSDGCYTINAGTGTSVSVTSGATCPSAPSVTTAAASSIAATSAVFNASTVANGNDAITAYGFKWGTTDACSSETVSASNLGSGTTFSATKSSLTNGTTYYYKAYATNGQGTTYGSVQSFRTKFVTSVTLDKQSGTGGTNSVSATEGSAMPSATAPTKTGYTFGGYYKNEGGSGTQYYNASMTSANNWDVAASTATIYAKWTANPYTITLKKHNGGSDGSVSVTFDANTGLTSDVAVPSRSGYTFAGYWTAEGGTGTKLADAEGKWQKGNAYISEGGNWVNAGNVTLHAAWTPTPYAITFDATTNGGALVGLSPKNVIFDETSVTSCPTAAKDGYCFDGWYSAASEGVKVIDAAGNLQSNVTVSEVVWTNGTSQWKKASATTVYAVYVAPTIEMTPDPTALNSRKTEKDTVVIHQTFSCEPTGNYNVVYTVGYSANHTQLPSQPTIKYGTGVGAGYDTIKMPMDANTYEIVAELRTGSTRGAGTIVKRDTIDYVVEAQYAVTLHYVVDGKNIRESRQVYAYPTSAPSEVRVVMEESGYELDYWELGVGIDTVSGRGSTIDGGILGDLESKYIYAANNGNIYLHYKPKANTVYFFNTFSMYWYQTIMKKYDYGTSDDYWQSTYGADSHGGLTNDTVKSTTTSLEEKKWMASIGGSTTHFAFTNKKMDNYNHFYGNAAGNEWARVIYRTDYNSATPMFVPVAIDDDDYYVMNQDANGAARYYRGFWVKYSPNSDSTGYYLHVYNQKAASGAKLIQSLPLRLTQTGEGNTWELTASMDLEGGKTYGFKITKATGVSTKAWYSYNGTLTAADHTGKVLDGTSDNIGLTTTSAGDYTFHVFCKDFGTIAANNATANQVQGQLAVTVDYATVSGDYRVIYSDATQTEVIASPSIHPLANGQDTVSFFIRKNAASRVMKIQRYTTNWADLKTVDLSSIAKDSVYVIYLQQNEGANDIEVAGYDFYDGDYYIRTDCVDEHKWDYKQSLANHRMTPSDYGMADIQPDKFTHYYVHWIGKGGNVKFIVANKYAPCLSDTVITDTYANVSGGNLPSSHGANVRFMYNKGTNVALRAYLYGSEEGNPNYLKITTSTSKMGTTATTPGVITTKTFTDEKNWVYQAEIKAKPGLTAKLTAEYNGNTQYFMGSASEEETIIGGTGDDWQKILLTYDFKVNRLICAWQPSGDSINGDVPINADVMIIREAQDDAQQIIFKNNDSKLSSVKYIYGVMQFNRNDMVGMMPRWDYWSYQHCMYYISFPFDVLVNDIMAPGRMGTEWRIQRYNGAKRSKGWFAGDGVTTFWEDVQAGDTLKAYEGYSLLLNRRIFNDGSSSVWQNKGAGSKLYMYFPSKDATTGVVANKTVNVTVPSHECTLDRVFDQDLGKPVSEQRNHKIVDSHWNMIGTPLFEDKVASTIADGPTIGSETLQYIYEWNPAGNTLGIRNTLTTGFEFKTMYSYMAQYTGTITFVGSAVNKIVAANRSANKKNYTINLELTKDDTFVGRTYVELRENAVDTFLLNEDVCMVKNGVSADMYTLAGAYEAGANVLSIDNHIVPVGVDVKAAGTYTFSMPGNFDGEIILVDNYMQTRTNLMMEDYEIALPKANISDRFYLEININKMPTAIDGVDAGDGLLKDGKAHKFIMNDQMYILKDGVIYDARGNRVK